MVPRCPIFLSRQAYTPCGPIMQAHVVVGDATMKCPARQTYGPDEEWHPCLASLSLSVCAVRLSDLLV